MNELVTVAVFTYGHEMAVVRARLEWEGITCFAKDEHTVAAHPLYSNLIGGIKLQVAAPDVEQARVILIEAGIISESLEEPTSMREFWSPMAGVFRVPSITPRTAGRVAIGIVCAILLLWILAA